MIFSRRASAGRHAKAGDSARMTPAEKRRAEREELLRELDLEQQPAAPVAGSRQVAAKPVAMGPYDYEDAPQVTGLVDLGSLLLPAIEGIEIRLQASETGVIQQIILAHAGSALQLGVFAAPRTEGLWDEVRAEIRKSLFDDGVGAEEEPGPWGIELRARLRTQSGFDDLRFIGVDGPRWLVRAVFQGAAAVDPEQSGPLYGALTGLVVRRDETARPTREPLPLKLPDQALEPEDQTAQDPPEAESSPRRRPSPRPRRD